MKSRKVEGNTMATKISMNPRIKPARVAPRIEPRPPRMAATKAFQPKTIPM